MAIPSASKEFIKATAKRISELIIRDYDSVVGAVSGQSDIKKHQRTIAGGKPKTGRTSSQKLLIYSNELQAAFEDSEKVIDIANDLVEQGIQLDANGNVPITEILLSGTVLTYNSAQPNIFQLGEFTDFGVGGTNPLNVGQYVNITPQHDIIDITKAKEILDTQITELIPDQKTRQKRIEDFFKEFRELVSPTSQPPNFDTDNDTLVDDEWYFPENSLSDQYSVLNDVQNQTNPYEGYIVRLDEHADSTNTGLTIEYLRNELDKYLRDIDEVIEPAIEEGRPKYINKSSGYIKLRNLNQGIIIRRQEGDDVGIEEMVEDASGDLGPSYLIDGFTITMWVRFLDKVNIGTLFNYGNPTRNIDPKGFKLETFVIDKDELMRDETTTWGEYAITSGSAAFDNNNKARFARLVVRDFRDASDNLVYDSHFGTSGQDRVTTTDGNGIPEFDHISREGLMLNYTQIPIDFDEWYFIVASFDPSNNEATGAGDSIPEYWLGYMSDASTYVSSPSGYGSKCKIEVISKSELLRARGYAPE